MTGVKPKMWHVSVVLPNPPHQYASNPRLHVMADTTDEIYDFVARRYPGGVIMGIWPSKLDGGVES